MLSIITFEIHTRLGSGPVTADLTTTVVQSYTQQIWQPLSYIAIHNRSDNHCHT